MGSLGHLPPSSSASSFFEPSASTLDCEIDELHPESLHPKPRWKQQLAAIIPGLSDKSQHYTPLPSSHSRPRRRRSRYSYCLIPTLGVFVMLGIVQSLTIVCGIVIAYFPDEFDRAASRWLNRDPSTDISRWPTDMSRDIIPVGCHSHNDYWRRVPLFSALQAGCVGVEADVWLFDQELYVGHSTSALTPERTLKGMYVDPLVRILDQQNPITSFHPSVDKPANGVFDTDPSQTLILLVDFKTDGVATWSHVAAQLSPLRDRGYLSYFNGQDVIYGPVTVVGTGNTPFDMVMANSSYRDIFFDAPLDFLADVSSLEDQRTNAANSTENLGQGLSGTSADITPDAFNTTSSFYASTSLKNSIGSPWPFHFSDKQMDRIRAQIHGAHRRGLKVRYWGLPDWPRSLRNHVWSVLVREGVDILNVDDLHSATRKEWASKAFDWF